MQKLASKILVCLLLLTVSSYGQTPSVETFKKSFFKAMQSLISAGYTERKISFVDVIAGKPNGGYYPFKVTAYVMDYGPGYPANKYYGQTCLGKMEGWKFDMLKDAFGEWEVQGRMTITGTECKDNPGEGKTSFSLPGVAYVPGANQTVAAGAAKTIESDLYLGEYACYGTGGRMMAGMGFHLMPTAYTTT